MNKNRLVARRMSMKKCYENGGIGFTLDHTAKMEGLVSLSTSVKLNKTCQNRAKDPNSICAKCYADSMTDMYRGLAEKLAHNTEILTTRLLSDNEIPFVVSDTMMARFEAFGDLNNEIQVANYFRIAELNPQTDFALWTKNPWFIDRAIKKYGISKPTNLRIIGSSYHVNVNMSEYFKRFDFIDNCFTVYTLDFVVKNHITITCGGLSCASCGKCYLGGHDDFEIRELLKSDHKKAKKRGDIDTF